MAIADSRVAEPLLLVCLHYLGGSARSWEPVFKQLGNTFDCKAIDLPGFGDAADLAGYGVADMADHVAAIVATAGPRQWVLAGHSMGATVAAVLARRAEDGEPGLSGLSRLILLAGSPPGPEPMEEGKRQAMLAWFANGPLHPNRAQDFITQNVAAPLDATTNGAAVADALRANPAAWLAWLQHGSKEDWSSRIGLLQTPALLVSGAADQALGPDAQRQEMAPHFANAQLVVLPDAGHLLPLERPDEIARLIAGGPARPPLRRDYAALIASPKVSQRTRDVLLARARPDDPAYQPRMMDADQFALLRAVASRVVPQDDAAVVDIAARLDAQWAGGQGDGWRFATLPADAEATRAALRTLANVAPDFLQRDASQQDDLLRALAAGQCGSAGVSGLLGPEQMRQWFEDLRADAARLYVSHPATLARIGYSGIGYGGDTLPLPGFTHVGAGERELWEPEAAAP